MKDPFRQSQLLPTPTAHCGFTPLTALPQYRFLCRAATYIRRRPAWLLAPLLLLTMVVAMSSHFPASHSSRAARIYLLVDESGPEVIMDYPTEDRDGDMLCVRAGDDDGDAQLILSPGQTVTVLHGEDAFTVESRQETVDSLLRRLEVTPEENEMVAINIAGDSPLIHVTDEVRCQRSEQTFSPYKTKSYVNYLQEAGTYELIQKGSPGTVTDIYEDVYRMGCLVDSLLIERKDDTAVTQIVSYGRLVHEVPQDLRAVSAHAFRDGSEGGYLLFEDGTSMIYTRIVTCSATAYYGGTRTASGHATGMGVIATDPSVFPFGTTMYIGSVSGRERVYGIGTAYDTGSAVKGNIIDVWYPTWGDCSRWGRRTVTCYILA